MSTPTTLRVPQVAVVGAGVAGIAAAAFLREYGVAVTVFEGSSRVGGKLALHEVAGIRVDVGAESMLNRRPEATDLARRHGLADRLVHPETSSARLWSRGRMTLLPPTIMGVPTDVRAVAQSGVLSVTGLARAGLDLLLPETRLADRDASVGQLVGQRLGSEVVDRLVEPLLGGVYAGHARNLSARAATPAVAALFDGHRSLLRAAAAASATASKVPVFAGLQGGLGMLPQAVIDSAAIDVRTAAPVRELLRCARGDWQLLVGSTRDARRFGADAVVLATPAGVTARLLRSVVPEAWEMADVEYASMAVVTLAFRRRDLPATTGSGFLVPPVDGRAIKAATYSFAKWDWVAGAGRGADAGHDVSVLRCSVGRHREEQALQVEDAELVDVVLADLSGAIGLAARPIDWHVQRWGGALPQYDVGHLDRVRRVREAVAREPGLAVCGAAYDGLGIAACVASAAAAVTQIRSHLARPRE